MDESISILEKIESNYKLLQKIASLKENSSISLFIKNKINSLLSLNREYKKILDEEIFLKSLLDLDKKDNSLSALEIDQINSELNLTIKSKKESLEQDIKLLLIKEEKGNENAIVEIRPGAGGLEASLFAQELYKNYLNLANRNKWKFKLIEVRADNSGFFNFASFLIEGANAYYFLKNEAGVHRVQRVPKTESKGRVHTSTVTVAVLPEAKEVEVDIPSNSIKIDTYRSSGAGGQHVNTTDSAVRITHIPTGIVVTSQDGRSQHSNKLQALLVLRSKILDHFKKEFNESQEKLRSSMIKNADRSEKIRTYNFPQNRITDHRLNKNFSLSNEFKNSLASICQSLVNFSAIEELNDIIKLGSVT